MVCIRAMEILILRVFVGMVFFSGTCLFYVPRCLIVSH